MIDISIFCLVALLSLFSYFNGFMKELFLVLSWVLSLIITLFFVDEIAHLLITRFPDFIDLRIGMSMLFLFGTSFFLLSWLNYLILNSIGHITLSIADRVLALFFCIARSSVIIIVLLLLAGLTQIPTLTWWTNSYIIQSVKPVVVRLQHHLPIEIAQQFQFEPLSEK
ncbi:MAG: CvpA family protein [Thiomargarita sp.]|nr:CvpA family protein [Thiomargarita sp.]